VRRYIFGLFLTLALAVLFAGVVCAGTLTDGLVGYWSFDGDGKDLAGNSEGSLEGDAKWTDDGRLNGAVMLDGVTGHVAISGFELITAELTAVAWLNGGKAVSWAGIMASRADPMSFWMGFTDAGTLGYVWNNNADTTWGWKAGPVIPEDEWAMLVITIDPDKAVAYVYTDSDGLESGTNEIAHIEQVMADNLKIGWDQCDNTRFTRGILDEVMIYNRALTKDEVQELATNGLAVSDHIDKLTTSWGAVKR